MIQAVSDRHITSPARNPRSLFFWVSTSMEKDSRKQSKCCPSGVINITKKKGKDQTSAITSVIESQYRSKSFFNEKKQFQ